MVEVEEQDREPPVGRADLQRAAQPVDEQPPVRQPGQRVVLREMPQAFLVHSRARDVARDPDEAARVPPVVGDRADREPFEIELAVLAPVPDLPLPAAGLPDVAPHPVEERAVVLARMQEARIAADELGAGVARDGAERVVGGHDRPVRVGKHDAVVHGLDHLPRRDGQRREARLGHTVQACNGPARGGPDATNEVAACAAPRSFTQLCVLASGKRAMSSRLSASCLAVSGGGPGVAPASSYREVQRAGHRVEALHRRV